MSLTPFVQILARGQGRARSLDLDEAEAAMAIMLGATAEPEALGAILMLLRMKGEVAPEIAGFARAARASLGGWKDLAPALDWPSYAAGRTRGLPWFLLSARLVAAAGHPVLLHGWNSHQDPITSVRAALPALAIAQADTPEAARQILARDDRRASRIPIGGNASNAAVRAGVLERGFTGVIGVQALEL